MKRKTIIKAVFIFLIAAVFIALSLLLAVPDNGESSPYYATFMALIPPLIAIILALITKEVFSSLFIGIIAGALLYTNFSPIKTLDTVINDGFISSLASASHAGILIFLVILGAMVALINKAGGSAAFGAWAEKHIKTRVGALLATFALGVLIFVDDYFNCLTVGSVMKPVTDSRKISRPKLAYIIDATAAPICIIAPVSSWAAAVAGVVVGVNGLALFVRTIPYNFYSLVTISMIIATSVMGLDFGPMKKYEQKASQGDLSPDIGISNNEPKADVSKSSIADIIIPVVVLILCCVFGMVYTGKLLEGTDFITAFANCDASLGLPWGAAIALILTVIYLAIRRSVSFTDAMGCLTKGFCAMVPAIMILTFAWTLNSLTSALGGDIFVHDLMEGAASGLSSFLPAIFFVVALLLAFSTGTSWGTFGILIPIVVFLYTQADGSVEMSESLVIGISACLAGAVCGDHCSPISDTTIMASAGAECRHIDHVATQLPYALTAAAVSFVSYIIAGFIQDWRIVMPISIALMLGVLLAIKAITTRKAQ